MILLRSLFRSFVLLAAGFIALSGQTRADEIESTPQHFVIPAGPAERALADFARQSKQPAIFTTDMLAGVQTSAVRGDYTALEALELMLAGTSLRPAFDAAAGTLVIRPAVGPSTPVIELPPYVVETNRVDPGRWSYARAPGVEVISRCSDATVELLLRHHFQLHAMLDALIPEEFRVKLDVPVTYVLYDEQNQPGIAREVISELRPRSGAHATVGVSGLSNYRFWDRDAVSIFFIINETDFNSGRLSLTPDYIRYMLENRAPSLPSWLIEGMMEVYRTTTMESSSPQEAYAAGTIGPAQRANGVVSIRPIRWISDEQTQAVRKNPRQRHPWLPLREIFAILPPVDDGEDRAALWQAEAALFVRWALDGGAKHPRKDALWEFVRRASLQPASETMFRECFGLDYAAAEQQLREYLPVAVKSTLYNRPDQPADLSDVKLRDATLAEVSRIKGGLDRMEITYIKNLYPELTTRYVNQARTTLRKSYNKGDRDPRLLAELGLCECDAGDDPAARPFLEAATHGRVVRPRAYYELARIYYQELLGHTQGAEFSAAEAGAVLKPLAVALKQSPPLPEIYELIAEVWLRTAGRLGPAQLAVLDEGVRNYPWRPRLIYSAALLNSMQGRLPEAAGLVERGLAAVTDAKEKEAFLKLQATLVGGPAAPNP